MEGLDSGSIGRIRFVCAALVLAGIAPVSCRRSPVALVVYNRSDRGWQQAEALTTPPGFALSPVDALTIRSYCGWGDGRLPRTSIKMYADSGCYVFRAWFEKQYAIWDGKSRVVCGQSGQVWDPVNRRWRGVGFTPFRIAEIRRRVVDVMTLNEVVESLGAPKSVEENGGAHVIEYYCCGGHRVLVYIDKAARSAAIVRQGVLPMFK